MAVTFRTECAHCARPLSLRVDSDLSYEIAERGAAPLVFVPHVNFATLKAPNIIDDF